MKARKTASASRKIGLAAAVMALIALGAIVPALAIGAYGSEATATTPGSVPTVYIKDGKKGLRFVAPSSVTAGEELKVVNETDPHKVGPHTFSLVTKGSLPKTHKAQKICFTKGHICKAIANWHGVKGNGPVKENPAEAGAAGWDTLGSLTTKGDSWFTGEKPGTSIVQQVTVDTTAGAQRIYFLCAIHPWMRGSINVLPAG
ncbi:MAG TPA: hypothetical protein VFL89_03765 [Solirubrobacterales bacterium]|nr:hypothetical protein [Solirubrobacterales bacterium]